MSTSNFIHRPGCELCHAPSPSILKSTKFANSEVRAFLEEYYDNRIELALLDGAPYEVAKCMQCGFMWQTWVLNDECLDSLYEEWISAEQSLDKKKNAPPELFKVYANEAKAISSLLSKKPQDISILEFGMGWGYWSHTAKSFGYKVIGAELSKKRILHAKSMGVAVVDDFSKLEKKSFDYIHTEQVFEHVKEPLNLLKQLIELLKVNGVIKISVPDGNQDFDYLLSSEWQARKDSFHPLEHINCFTHESLIKFGQAAGLKFLERPFSIIDANPLKTSKNVISNLLGRNKCKGTALYFERVS